MSAYVAIGGECIFIFQVDLLRPKHIISIYLLGYVCPHSASNKSGPVNCVRGAPAWVGVQLLVVNVVCTNADNFACSL